MVLGCFHDVPLSRPVSTSGDFTDPGVGQAALIADGIAWSSVLLQATPCELPNG